MNDDAPSIREMEREIEEREHDMCPRCGESGVGVCADCWDELPEPPKEKVEK